MQEKLDGIGGGVNPVGALRLGRQRGLIVTQTAQLIGEIAQRQIDTDVKMVTIGIDFRGEIPFTAFEFLGDFVFPVLEKPCAATRPAVVMTNRTMRPMLKNRSLNFVKSNAPIHF